MQTVCLFTYKRLVVYSVQRKKHNARAELEAFGLGEKVCGAGSVDVVALFIGIVTTHLRNDYMHNSVINYIGACLGVEDTVCTVGERRT